MPSLFPSTPGVVRTYGESQRCMAQVPDDHCDARYRSLTEREELEGIWSSVLPITICARHSTRLRLCLCRGSPDCQEDCEFPEPSHQKSAGKDFQDVAMPTAGSRDRSQ